MVRIDGKREEWGFIYDIIYMKMRTRLIIAEHCWTPRRFSLPRISILATQSGISLLARIDILARRDILGLFIDYTGASCILRMRCLFQIERKVLVKIMARSWDM